MDKVQRERIRMLKQKAADELNATWDAEERGDHELAGWHWDQFVRAMTSARELKELRRNNHG